MASQRIRIAVTPGAEDGVGPELLARAIVQQKKDVDFFWCGDFLSLERAALYASIAIEKSKPGQVILGGHRLDYCEEIFSDNLLRRSAQFLEVSMARAQAGLIDAVVTGPINKAALAYLDCGNYPGQTEYFFKLAGEKKPFMAFLGGPFMLSLLTTHIPLNAVANALNQKMIEDHLESVAHHGTSILSKKKSALNIVVLGLNPHAGEGGLIGNEENDILVPAIKNAIKTGLNVQGPLPADGFFAYFHKLSGSMPDAVIAIYHDQGLIPYKLLAQGRAVNVTLGLSIPRVSPAHGTASLLVGRRQACPQSTMNAIETAINLVNKTTTFNTP